MQCHGSFLSSRLCFPNDDLAVFFEEAKGVPERLHVDCFNVRQIPLVEQGFPELLGHGEEGFDTDPSQGFIFEIVDIPSWFLLDVQTRRQCE
jgi:hypothetical protein